MARVFLEGNVETSTAMFDITLRPLKDKIFDPLCRFIPTSVPPLYVTAAAFLAGLLSCWLSFSNHRSASLLFWSLNRVFDCLDGAIARQRSQSSDLGGFLDLLGDFIIYSLIPISTAAAGISTTHTSNEQQRLWIVVSMLEASFHINNFVLFYVAALIEKFKAVGMKEESRHLTSLSMRPALIEGVESALIFTAMLAKPSLTLHLSLVMSVLVALGTLQRVSWIFSALGHEQLSKEKVNAE